MLFTKDTDSFYLDAELMKEYRQHREFFFDKNVMLATFGAGMLWFFCRSNIQYSLSDGVYFSTACVAMTLTVIIYIGQLPLQIFQDSNLSYCKRLRSTFSIAWIRFLFHDCLAIFGTLGGCVNFYGRSVSAQCPRNVSLWNSQRCNHVADASSMPTESVAFMLVLPLYLQMLISGLSFKASFACFCLTTVSLALATSQLGGHLELWIFLTSFLVLLILYNSERLSRVTFLRYCHVHRVEVEKRGLIGLQLQAVDDLNSEKMSHLTEIFKMRSQEECRMTESEKKHMIALLGNVAHDLRTPLQSFLMDLEALKAAIAQLQYVDKVPEGIDSVWSIVTSLESACIFMSVAINRSTDYFKVNHGFALVPRMELFSISDELSGALNVIRLLKPLLTIIVNPLPDSISMEIISDKQWFYENVLCLLSNAAKYCDGGTVTVTVEHSPVIPPGSQPTESSDVTLVDRACTSTSTSPTAAQPSIIISVEDTGIGISEDRRKDLFKPLKQTDRQSGGTGLGLYCLSNRVSALKGTRGVSSRTNGLQGSLFWFAIPYHPPPHFLTLPTHSMDDIQISPCYCSPVELSSQENIAAPMSSPIPFVPIPTPILIPNPLSILIPSIHRNQLGNLRFLVVDDSPSIVKVLNRVLSNQKYAVDTAENGKFALDRMKEAFVSRSLDIVLMDLQMPIMDGIEAVTLYRQYEDSQRPQSSSIYPSPHCSLSTSGATSTLSASSAASSPAHASPKESSPSPGERSPSYPSMREIDHDHDTDKVNNSLFIIGMSASSDEKYEVAALTAGMNYFLPKPFTMNELQPLIERFRTIQEA